MRIPQHHRGSGVEGAGVHPRPGTPPRASDPTRGAGHGRPVAGDTCEDRLHDRPAPGSGNASLTQRFHCHRRSWTGSANGRARRFYPAPTTTDATGATIGSGESAPLVRSRAHLPGTRRHARPPVRRKQKATTPQARRGVSGRFQNASCCRTRLKAPLPGSTTPPPRVGTCDHRTLELGSVRPPVPPARPPWKQRARRRGDHRRHLHHWTPGTTRSHPDGRRCNTQHRLAPNTRWLTPSA